MSATAVAGLTAWLSENAPDTTGRFDIRPRPLEVVYEQAKALGIALRRDDALDIAEGRKPFVGRYRGRDGGLRSYNPRFVSPPRPDYRLTPEAREMGWRLGLPDDWEPTITQERWWAR